MIVAALLPIVLSIGNDRQGANGDIILAALILGFFMVLAACVRYVTMVGWPWKKKST